MDKGFHFHFATSEMFFPKQWNCTKNMLSKGKLEIFCLVKTGQYWNITEFRNWSAPMENEISLHLKCTGTGRILLKKPIKANGLVSLYVDGCTIREYLTFDFSEEVYEINDTLRVFETTSCLHEINVQELLLSYEKDVDAKMKTMYPCEHNKYLHSFTERNISHNLIGLETLSQQDIVTLTSNVDRSLYERPKCEYPYLEYFEISNSPHDPNTSFDAIRYFLNNGKFPAMRVFNFSNLGLTDIPDSFYRNDWWINMSRLEELDLTNNKISTIRFKYRSSISTRTPLRVDFRNNALKLLKEDDIRNLKSFYPNTVNLRNNSFVCSCDNKDMVNFIQKGIRFGQEKHYQYLNATRCKESKYQGKLLVNVPFSDLCSNIIFDHVKHYYSIYVSLGIFIVLVLIIVFIRFRNEIKILANTRLFPGRAASSNEYLFKEFDAFVSYSALDEDWVIKCLCKRLETSPPHFKLCLHHKHFIPGACISDNIIESVEKSRHTVMVLSQNFLKSEWCLLEFRKAFHQSLIERNRHLIVIITENVSGTDLPVDMKHFLETYTYIRAKDPLFWDKLIYAITDRKKDLCCCVKSAEQSSGEI